MNKELGKRIKTKRKKDRLSAEDLAVKLGATGATNIYKWEGGSIPEDPTLYNKLMDWLTGGANNSYQNLLEVLVQKLIVVSETTNNILKTQQDSIVTKVDNIETNLDKTMVGVDTLQLEVYSVRQVALKSLARIENPKGSEDVLLKEADNIMEKMRGNAGKRDKT